MISSGERPSRLGFWVVVLVGVLAWAPATYPGYWQGLEGYIPVFNVTQGSAIASVATAADLWRGAGSAGFLLAQPFLLLGFSPVEAVRAVFILAFVLGGLSVYAWLRPIYGDRAAGLSGVVYIFLPMVLATVYIRGSLSDAMILALLPLTLASTSAYASSRSPAIAALTLIGVLWMWRTQAGLALFASLLLVAYALYVERDRIAALVVGVSAAAGLISLIPLWSLQAPTPIIFADHFVHAFQLFGNGWAVAPSEPGWQDGYPFQLGFAAVTFSIVALWLRLRAGAATTASQQWARLFDFALVGALVFIVLSLTVSAFAWDLSRADRLLTYPWQIFLIAAPLLAATAGALPLLNVSLGRTPYWVVLVALVVLASYSYLTTDFTQIAAGSRPYSVIGSENNIALLDARLTEAEDRASAELAVTWQALQPLPFDYNVFFQAVGEDGESFEVLAQLDGQPLHGERPATSWRQGELLQDTYTLDLSQVEGDLSDANIRYYFGYYDWRDGTRLPVDGGIDDKLVFYGR